MPTYVRVEGAPALLEVDPANESDVLAAVRHGMERDAVIEIALSGQYPEVHRVLCNLGTAARVEVWTASKAPDGESVVRFYELDRLNRDGRTR